MQRLLVDKTVRGVGLVIALGVLLVPALSWGLSRGYSSSDEDIRSGMAVVLSGQDNSVERASTSSSGQFVGVATNGEDSTVAISSGGRNVLVETDGQIEVLVSDLGGALQSGDLLVLSPLKGVLAKSSGNGERAVAIAVAAQDFSSSDTASIDTRDGSREVRTAKVLANLDPKAVAAASANSPQPSTLERLGERITGREVSEARVILTVVLFLIVLVVEGGIIYGAVSTSLTSLGRNPMARKSINRDLVRIAGVAVIVLGIGLGAMYLMLWA